MLAGLRVSDELQHTQDGGQNMSEQAAGQVAATAATVEVKRRNRGPDFTARDAAALQWVGEQYGCRLDVLGVLLGRLGTDSFTAPALSLRGVRNQVDRWERQGLVRRERALASTWVTLTRHGLDRVGLSFPTWAVPTTRVRHCHAVNIVRLWYEATQMARAAPWISERLMYQERGKDGTWHIPDGVVRDPRDAPDGPIRHIAIEVELTHKGRRAYDDEVLSKLRAGVDTLYYFVPDEAFKARLAIDIQTVQERKRMQKVVRIDLLPGVPGVTYDGNW